MAEQKKIDVVIPAYKPGEKFQKLIKMLQKQTYPIHEILIMNTEKAYFPEASVAGLPNVRVEHLTRAEFDHGGTRDKAAGLLSGDFFLFMTQDAVPADTYLVKSLPGHLMMKKWMRPMPASFPIRTVRLSSVIREALTIRTRRL